MISIRLMLADMDRQLIMHVLTRFVVLLISRLTCVEPAEISKACFGPPSLPCTTHTLTCSSGSIAIQDAFYTDSTVCGPEGISNCVNINVNSIPDNGRGYNFSLSEMDSLYGNCSTQSTCRVNAGRRFPTGFSTIKYVCINESINMCDDTTQRTTDISLLGREGNSTCTCTISTTNRSTFTSITALDMRLKETSERCTGVAFSVDGNILHVNCSDLSPNQLLVNTTGDMTLTMDTTDFDTGNIAWIRVQATATIELTCNNPDISTTQEGTSISPSAVTETSLSVRSSDPSLLPTPTPKVSSVTSAHAGSTTEEESHVTSEAEGDGFPGGIYVAGIATGVLVVVVIAAVVYFVVIRRRFVIKKAESGPTSLGHPTYAGLTDLGRPDTYDVINNPEGVTRKSELSQAPVYQNVDDTS